MNRAMHSYYQRYSVPITQGKMPHYFVFNKNNYILVLGLLAGACPPQRVSSNVFVKLFSQDWAAIRMDFSQFCRDVTPHSTVGFMLQHEDVTSDSTVGLKWQYRDVTSLLGTAVLFDGAGYYFANTLLRSLSVGLTSLEQYDKLKHVLEKSH